MSKQRLLNRLRHLYREGLFLVLFLVSLASSAQDIYQKYGIYRNPVRVALNKISWTAAIGYGQTQYKHELAGNFYYQDQQSTFIIPKSSEGGLPSSSVLRGYDRWTHNPIIRDSVDILQRFDVPYDRLDDPVNNPSLNAERVLIDSDTADLGFTAPASSIPIHLGMHMDIENFRVGLGGMYEKQWIQTFKPTSIPNLVNEFKPSIKSHYWKIYGIAGYRIYEYWDYMLYGEVQVGKMWASSDFNKDFITRGIFVNLGLTFEKHLSEYFRIIVRPSYEVKSYTVNLPAAGTIASGSVRHAHNSFQVIAGITINIPEIPRSPMKSDHVQLKHVITDPATGRLMEVRGQPIWKKQNPKVGENHRRLWRYKLRNRRKLNPY